MSFQGEPLLMNLHRAFGYCRMHMMPLPERAVLFLASSQACRPGHLQGVSGRLAHTATILGQAKASSRSAEYWAEAPGFSCGELSSCGEARLPHTAPGVVARTLCGHCWDRQDNF